MIFRDMLAAFGIGEGTVSGIGWPEILIVGLIAFPVYILPVIVASRKKHRNTGAILFLNLILGWTILVWVACYIWAVAGGRQNEISMPSLKKLPDPEPEPEPETYVICRSCSGIVYSDAQRCPRCGAATTQAGESNDFKRCPHCGEEIPATAQKCRYCLSSLGPPSSG